MNRAEALKVADQMVTAWTQDNPTPQLAIRAQIVIDIAEFLWEPDPDSPVGRAIRGQVVQDPASTGADRDDPPGM